MNILITGATGFIGQRLIHHLLAQKSHNISALVRDQNHSLPADVKTYLIASLDGETNYSEYLNNIDVVIHLAARVHRMDDLDSSSFHAYKATNTDATSKLAEQAAIADVKRFIYLSTIKVNGETTMAGYSFSADDIPQPSDPYAVSKYQAEQALRTLSKATGLEHVIIRPPLVYGPGVKANFEKLIGLVKRGIPLPFGAINNRRSLVSIDNLINLIVLCISHPKATNQTFLVSDDKDLSTTDLLRLIASSMNKTGRLIPVPEALLSYTAKLFGKSDIAQRLLGNLQVDLSKTKSILDWQPEITPEEGIRITTEYFLNKNR